MTVVLGHAHDMCVLVKDLGEVFPLLDMHQLALEAALVTAHEFMADNPGSEAFIGGSVCAGLGTPHSDVDLFVFGSGEVETQQLGRYGERIDVEFHDVRRLRQLVETLEDAARGADHEAASIDISSADLLARFATGRLVSTEGELPELRRRLEQVSTSLEQSVSDCHARRAINGAEDVAGFVDIDAWPAARYSARWVIWNAAEALLAARGDVYVGPKWIWHRWLRTMNDGPLAELAGAVAGGGDADHDERVGVFSTLRLAQALLIERHYPGAGGLSLEPERPGGLSRDPLIFSRATSGGVHLYPPSKPPIRVSIQGLVLWGVAHGRTRADAVEATTQALAERHPVERDQVDAYLGKLVDLELLTAS